MHPNLPSIAIVDDDQSIAEAVVRLLQSLGYSAVDFKSAGSLLAANPGQFDCIITDVQMPDVDGIMLLSVLKAEHPSVPVILVTGFLSDLIVDKAMAGGAACVLAKPFDDLELDGCLRRALAGPRGA